MMPTSVAADLILIAARRSSRSPRYSVPTYRGRSSRLRPGLMAIAVPPLDGEMTFDESDREAAAAAGELRKPDQSLVTHHTAGRRRFAPLCSVASSWAGSSVHRIVAGTVVGST